MTSWTVDYKPQGSVPRAVELTLHTLPAGVASGDCKPNIQGLFLTAAGEAPATSLSLDSTGVDDVAVEVKMLGDLCCCPVVITSPGIEMGAIVMEFADGIAWIVPASNRASSLYPGLVVTFTPTVCGLAYAPATITFF